MSKDNKVVALVQDTDMLNRMHTKMKGMFKCAIKID